MKAVWLLLSCLGWGPRWHFQRPNGRRLEFCWKEMYNTRGTPNSTKWSAPLQVFLLSLMTSFYGEIQVSRDRVAKGSPPQSLCLWGPWETGVTVEYGWASDNEDGAACLESTSLIQRLALSWCFESVWRSILISEGRRDDDKIKNIKEPFLKRHLDAK